MEGVRDPAVHHVHGPLLPVQHLLDGVVGGDPLGVQRDYDVDGKSGMTKEATLTYKKEIGGHYKKHCC